MDELDVVTIGRRSVQGVLALISRQFILNVISFGASLTVFTFLSPRDVGVYTAITAMQRIVSFFTDFGLGAALVQKKEEMTQEDLRTTFTLQAVITFVIFITLFLLRDVISSFFKLSPQATRLLLVLVFSIFLSSFKIIPSIILERKIQFHRLVIPQIVESLLFNTFLVALVLSGYRLDSYTIAFLVSGILAIPFYYKVAPWKIQLGIDRESIQHLRYGVAFQAKNILATIKDDLLTVVLVKFISFTEIGYIGFAQKFAFFAFRYVVDSITKVTFSTYSRIQKDLAYLQRAIEKSLFFVAVLMFPILSGLAITAPYIIQLIPKWHNKWEPAILSLIFFCLNAGFSSLSNILVNVLDASGRVHTTLRLMILWTTLTWVLTPICIFLLGYNGVALASFFVTLTIFLTVYLVRQIVPFRFFTPIYKPLIATFFMSLVVFLGTRLLPATLVSLIAVIVVGGVVYALILYLLARDELQRARALVFAKR